MSQRRRGRGEGSIVQRSDKRWMGRVDLGWRDGKRRTKATYGKTRREVSDKLRDLTRAAHRGTLIEDERETVERFLRRWLADVARVRVRPRTLATYEAAIERHLIPHIGRVPLSKLSPQHLQAWLRHLEESGVSAQRRRYARVVLRIALNTAMRWNLVVRNAATLVDAPRVTSREIRPLSPDESRLFLEALEDHPLEALFTVGLACGLRAGEALGLQWPDCDLEQGTLTVRRALQRFGGDASARRTLGLERRCLLRLMKEATTAGDAVAVAALRTQLLAVRAGLRKVKTTIHAVEPKSARSRRTIALPSAVVKALGRHRVRQLEARLASGSAWQETGYVFTSSIGTPIDLPNATRAFKAVLKAAKLPTIRLHDLRHSCATLLLAQGVNPRVVMETLGHSQVSLTLNTYSHVLPALQRDAASKMDAILAGS